VCAGGNGADGGSERQGRWSRACPAARHHLNGKHQE